jgi:putative nucleotidyltransferase with HDIG domain
VAEVLSNKRGFYLLTVMVTLAAGALALVPDWQLPTGAIYLNGIVAFALLGVASDSFFVPVSRISFENISTSVAFIPLLATVLLFPHPWPMAISGATALVVNAVVKKKPFPRVWFNTVQYVVFVGVGSLVYTGLGGPVGLEHFKFATLPFAALVVTFFALNQGLVAVALHFISGVRVRESWERIVGSSLFYDLIASSLAVLLVFLYIELQFIGLAILILPLLFVRHMYQMNLQVERVNRELLELMVKAIEARDPYTSGHSVRVSEYARSIARELGLSPKQVDQIATAALLHDVGKIYEDFAPLLRKEGKLTPEERMLMQAHPVRSAELAGTIAEFRGRVQTDIRNHHENYDGTGYPDGLVGEGIPVGARIVMIADTLDAMTTDRPYRRALTLSRTLEELKKHSGRQFDPRLVDLVCRSPSIRRLLGPQALPSSTADQAKPAQRSDRSPVHV